MTEQNERSAFTDAAYTPKDELPNLPPVYRRRAEKENDAERKPRKITAGRAVALCIFCLFLGAALNELSHERNSPAAEIPPMTVAEFSLREASPAPQDTDALASGVPEAYMGVIVQTVSRSVADYYNQYKPDSVVVGAQIFAVDENGAAAASGLQKGDIITCLGGHDVCCTSDLTAAETEFAPGESAAVQFFRDGGYAAVVVTFTKRPTTSEAESDYFRVELGW